MITVRFPTGVAIQYNDAHYVEVWGGMVKIKTGSGDDGKLVAMVPTDAIIEWHKPCRVYNTNHEPSSIVDALNRMIGDLAQRRLLPTYELAELKRRLAAFNGKRKEWQ